MGRVTGYDPMTADSTGADPTGRAAATRREPPTAHGHAIAPQTESRLATAMAACRGAMAVLVFVPLLAWERLAHPILAVVSAAVATAEALWLLRRVRSRRTLVDSTLISVDVVTAMALMVVGGVAAGSTQLNKVMTEVLPFALASAGFVGFGLGLRWPAPAIIALMAGTWTVVALPGHDLKIVSDLLGFGLWYAVSTIAGQEFRKMARLTEQAQADAAWSQQQVAERTREADVARERDITHREIHEHLLPIVDAVGSGKPIGDRLIRLAAREADRARRLIMDGRLGTRPGFEALVADVRDTYVDAGLQITPVFRIVADPPPDVGEAIAGAAREALCNVLKYAGPRQDVNFYVEATEAGVEVVVRDRGIGFDPDQVAPGGGFSRTYEAVRRRGGQVTVLSRPGEGTKVTFRWQA